MKELQNNFTIPEQSRQLLELGVPANSADCYYENVARIEIRQGKEKDNDFFTFNHVKYLPCWSLGRLLEIWFMCFKGYGCTLLNDVYHNKENNQYNYIHNMVDGFKRYIDHVDFSKLEV